MAETAKKEGLTLADLRKQFNAYAGAKSNEIEEWRVAHRYYAGSQWDQAEIATLSKRKQPVITFNRVSRKIDGVVGTIRRLRTDPKAFPRTQAQAEAADLATQVVRYVLDASEFEDIEAEACLGAGIIGYAACELSLDKGDHEDPDIRILDVDPRTFFYDPRSFKPDFSDARYMGTYKWATIDEVEEIAPGMGEKVKGERDGGYSTQAETDRDDKWTDDKERVKIVDHWYIHGGKWHWCLHVGTTELSRGESPFFDDRGKSICKFLAWSAYVDHDGDRYGFVRNLKGPQDAINQHRSKAIHIMNTRQIKARRGAVADIEKLRAEAMRPDGVMLYDGDPGEFEVIQPDQEFIQQTQYFQDAKDEIENFGPNAALIGTGVTAKSGRAMAMMQQQGLSELGPFLKNYRMWKLAIYQAIWGACKRYWQSERWLRITGDQKVAQFVQLNGLQLDEYGNPVIVNQLGNVSVDIVLDEGPDTENVMSDVFDTLQAIAQNGVAVPPQVIIEMSTLPNETKEKLVEMLTAPPPDPMQEQAKQIALEAESAKVEKTKAETLKVASDALINEQQLGMNAQNAAMEIAANNGLQVTGGMQAPMQGSGGVAPIAGTAGTVGAMDPMAAASVPAPMPAPQPMAIQIGTDAMDQAAMAMHGMASQNTEFMGQASQSMAMSADSISQAANAMAQATAMLAAAVEKMAAPKRLVRDPKTGRASHTEVMA